MPNLTPLQQLTQTIYKTFPDLKKLDVGCEIDDYHSKKQIIYKSREVNSIVLLDVFCNETGYDRWKLTNGILTQKIKDKDIIFDFNILGKKITLTDVLRWMKGLNINVWDYHNSVSKLLNLWDLEHSLLENQSIELVEFLNNLKK